MIDSDGGDTGAQMRAHDWSKTALGPAESWPPALQALVRALLHTRQPMLLWWGPELIQLYNDAFAPSLGEKHPRAMGQPARLCWPEVWPVVGAQIEAVLAHGRSSLNEELLVPVFRNGRLEDAWWNYSYSPAFDDDGAVAGVLIICTETTAAVVARKQLEGMTREAQLAREEIRAVFSQAPVPMAILAGPEHRFALTNSAYDAMVGRSTLGKSLAEAFTDEEVGYYRPILDHVYRSGEPITIREAELQLRRADGAMANLYIDASYSAYRRADGVILGVMAVHRDVTAPVVERQLTELAVQESRKLAETLEQSGDFMGIADPDGVAFWLNAAGRRLVGLGAHDSIDRRLILDFFDEANQARMRDEVLPAVARSGKWEGELSLRHFATVEPIAVWYSIFQVRDAGDMVIGLGTVARDIRPQKALEAERAAMLEREQTLRVAAEASGRARDEFLAMLGHELRNPLAPIATATELMRLRGDWHEKERRIIERQVEHLSRLVDDLLDVARVARGKIDLQRHPVEISEVVAKAIEMASPLLEQRVHRLSLRVPRTGLVVDGDAVRLAQVVGNLVTNAAKYTPQQGHIEISAERAGAEVVVTVADSGPGIREELLPRIFDLFVQGPQQIDRAEGGLGLGLALVKNLVALHGGSVSAKNRPAGGSEFSVRLPALADAIASGRPQATLAADRSIAAAREARRILVVDDNEDAAELLSELLRNVGHEVVVAYDGPQALEALRTFGAEVALLDLGLPGMDGFELARRIRQQRGPSDGLRLIAVTGYGQEHDREGTRSAGFDLHLTKPVPIADLIRVIDRDA
jgi:signal transduction histidine kinase/ActR/RegA family two-component response regulator